MLEANPRASRTVPFASKATGMNLVDAACRLAAGARIADLGLPPERPPEQVDVKAAVLPFARFPGADPVLGPEMRSTGEVMASAGDFPSAFAKAERAAGRPLPTAGRRSSPCATPTRPRCCRSRRRSPTSASSSSRPPARRSRSPTQGSPSSVAVEKGEPSSTSSAAAVDLVVNTPEGRNARTDGYAIREAALVARVPCITTLAGAAAAVHAIAKARAEPARTLQERHAEARAS